MTLSNAMALHARQLRDADGWIILAEIQKPNDTPGDDPEQFRITNALTEIPFGTNSAGEPVPYYPFPFSFTDFRETTDGDLPQLTLQVGNPSLELAAIMEFHAGLTGSPVTLRIVQSAALDDYASQVSVSLEVLSASMDDRVLAVKLGGGSLVSLKIPPDRYSRYHCSPGRVPYGGNLCGYDLTNPTLAAAFPTCQRTKEACTAHGDAEVAAGLLRLHPLRFGGRPSIPRQRKT